MDHHETNKIMASAFQPETRITDLLASLKRVKAALADRIESVRPARKVLSDARKALDAAILERCRAEHDAVETAKANVDPAGYHYLETCRDTVRAALTAKGYKSKDSD